MKPDSTGLAPNHGTKPWLLVSVGSVGQLHWLTRSRNCAPIVRTSVPCPSCTTARFAMTRTMRLTRNSKNTTTLWRTRCGHRQNPWTLELSQQPGCDAINTVYSSSTFQSLSPTQDTNHSPYELFVAGRRCKRCERNLSTVCSQRFSACLAGARSIWHKSCWKIWKELQALREKPEVPEVLGCFHGRSCCNQLSTNSSCTK